MTLNPLVFLLTDTLPFELPIIFTNKNFYNHLVSNYEQVFNELKLEMTNNPNKSWLKYTIPCSFHIQKNDVEYRKLGLLNPYGQLLITKFNEQYSKLILLYFKQNSEFSIRRPIGVNNSFNDLKDKHRKEFEWMIDGRLEDHSDEKDPLIRNYYCLSKYPKITDFYKSYYSRELETKYNYMLKLDFQNCFGSIYTHSLDWAYLGSKELAKSNLNNKQRFSFVLDSVVQCINYNETNGIIIGPEFSRTVAEILLTRIDKEVLIELENNGIYYRKDYEIVRFIDDIFIFYNKTEIGEEINRVISKIALEYKMNLNEKKKFIETRPFLKTHFWVPEIKEQLRIIFDQFETLYSLEEGVDLSVVEISYSKYLYSNFIDSTKKILTNYSEQRRYVISYIISTFENKLSIISENLSQIPQTKLVVEHIKKIIDSLFYVITYNLSADNTIKLCRIILKLSKVAQTLEYDIDDLIFMKTLRLLKYNKLKITELLNFLIIIKSNKNHLPTELLKDLLSDNTEYFTLSTIAYYSLGQNEEIYSDLKESINGIVKDYLENITFKYSLKNKQKAFKDHNAESFDSYDDLLCSDDFYIVHDFASYPDLDEINIDWYNKFKTKLKLKRDDNKFKLYNMFLSYVIDMDKPFMRWTATNNELIEEIYLKKYRGGNDYN